MKKANQKTFSQKAFKKKSDKKGKINNEVHSHVFFNFFLFLII